MRASVLLVCVVVAAAIACPLGPPKPPQSSRPRSIPITWQVKRFDNHLFGTACSGIWYVQMNTPTFAKGQTPLKTSLFYSYYPGGGCNRLLFYDNDVQDYSYYLLDSSYNYITQNIDTTQSVFTAAYPDSDLAIFNVITQPTYTTPLLESKPISDDKIIKYQLDQFYQRGYTVVCVGGDATFSKYMLLVVLNDYDSFFNGSGKHIIWLITRSKVISSDTYQQAYNDLLASRLNPSDMVSVDQSINFDDIPTISKDDILGVVKKTTKTTESSSSSSSNGAVTSSSKKTTIEETTTVKSTVDITLNSSFSTPYQYGPYLSGDLKILKDFSPSVYKEAITGKYFLTLATPFKGYDKGQPSLLYTVFPSGSPQVYVDNTDLSPFKPEDQYMMVYRAYNVITGEIIKRRCIVQCPYYTDGSIPYGALLIYSEQFSEETITEVSPFSYDTIKVNVPNGIYTQKYVMGMLAYKSNSYLILGLLNEITNQFSPNSQTRPVYVFTRDRQLTKQTTEDINQELLRSGYSPSYLVHMDQTQSIDDTITFDRPYFYPQPNDYINPLLPPINDKYPPTYPRCYNPEIGPHGGLGPAVIYPKIIPRPWTVKQFDDQQKSILFQGLWNLQFSTPVKMPDNSPLKGGLWYPGFPSTRNRLFIRDTTPLDESDFNLEFSYLDTSFNVITQQIESTQGLLRPAYPKSKFAIFNVCSPSIYKNPFTDTYPLDDQTLIKYKLNQKYTREFTIALINCDENFDRYMIWAVVNKYNNVYNGCGNIVWVFTRREEVDTDTYNQIQNDLINSGFNPNNLMSIDHSIDLSTISTVTQDDIDGVIKITKYEKEESSTTSTSSDGITSSTSSSKQTTIEKTTTDVSPYSLILRPDYKPSYTYASYKYSGSVKVLSGLTPDQVKQIFQGKYYGHFATPFKCYDGGKVGILNTVYPLKSPFTQFAEYDSATQSYYMVDGGYNTQSGQVDKTRSIIQYPYDKMDGSTPYATYVVHTEGYYKQEIKETVAFDYNGFKITSPGPIYKYKFMITIIAYRQDSYVAFYILNPLNNQLSDKITNQLYVMGRNRIMTKQEIDDCTQSLLYSGYDVSQLSILDQTKTINEQIAMDASYFEIVNSSSSSSTMIESTSSISSTVIEESSSSSSSSAIEILSN